MIFKNWSGFANGDLNVKFYGSEKEFAFLDLFLKIKWVMDLNKASAFKARIRF
jgi:hypothetical protein